MPSTDLVIAAPCGSGDCRRFSHALEQGRVFEVREGLAASGDVDGAVAVVRHRPRARRALDGGARARDRYRLLGDGAEGVQLAGGDVERAEAPVLHNASDDLGYVVDVDVVAALLALAEQHDVLAFGRQAAEAVGAVAVVRIGRTVDQGGAQVRLRGLYRGAEG